MQCTKHILMVRPANFGFNPETAESNVFQVNDHLFTADQIKEKAKEEFDTFVNDLTGKGILVHVIEDSHAPVKPDAVFPNNWFTTHASGTIITYPMQAEARRKERREEIILELSRKFRFHTRHYLEFYESEQKYLEGTGSLIPDRINKLVYACISPRTHPDLVAEYCQLTGYQAILFHATDQQNREIYHTNVMMTMGDQFVVICMDAVKDPSEHKMLQDTFEKTNKEMIRITMDQMNAFAGNMLQVKNDQNQTFLVMSEQAYNALRSDQVEQIRQFTQIIHSPIYTIEKYGGGSARCMMAEIFLPER